MSTERDYVTIFQTHGGTRANKRFEIDAKGEPFKIGAPKTGTFIACQTACADLAAYTELKCAIGCRIDQVLSCGLLVGAVPNEPFLVLSRADMAAQLQVDVESDAVLGWHDLKAADGSTLRATCRLKANMVFSRFVEFDRDLVEGMPPELADLDFDAWRGAMCQLLPPLRGAGGVLTVSSSRRVRLNGAPVSSKPAWHYAVQVEDPDELYRVWPQLLSKSFATMLPGTSVPLGFLRPKVARDGSRRVVAHQPWSIFDPSTCSEERFVYDGQPEVQKGVGYTVDPPEVTLFEGGRVDLSAFENLTVAQQRAAERKGVRIERRKAKPGERGAGAAATAAARVRGFYTVSATLRLGLELETKKAGLQSIAALWISGAGKTPCQSPFRESSSWAAFYNVHDDGVPFVFDAVGVKYVLHPDDGTGPPVDDFLSELFEWSLFLTTAPAEEVFTRVRRIGAACWRHGWSRAEIDECAIKIANLIEHLLSQPRRKLVENIGKLLREAAKLASVAAATHVAARLDQLRDFNERYGAVLFGSKFAIVRERRSAGGWFEPEFLAAPDCSLFHAPDKDDQGEPLFDAWLGWEERNTFSGVVMEPSVSFRDAARPLQQGGVYNAWQGYGYRPVEGECELILEHVRDVLCAGREEACTAAMNHLAGMVQHPELTGLPLLALVSKEQGTGKNLFFDQIFLPLYGTHGIVLDRPEALTGRFNSHMGWNVFAYINEAIWGGDKQREGAYKTMFTDAWRPLEKKFRDIIMVKNFTKGVAASNNPWFAPIALHDRRHFVLDVSPHRAGDKAYFKALAKHINEGGREAFLAKLLKIDVDFDMLRQPPELRSPAKVAAMMKSAETVDRFLFELLSAGELPKRADLSSLWREQAVEFGRSALFEAYIEWTWRHAFGKPETQTAFGRCVYGTYGDMFVDPAKDKRDRNHQRMVVFKKLAEAREAFRVAVGLPGMWDELRDPRIDPVGREP